MLCYAGLKVVSHYTFVSLQIENSHSSFFKVYWTTDQHPSWSEGQSSVLYANSQKNNFILPLDVALADIRLLRFDPAVKRGVDTTILRIGLHNVDTRSSIFDSAEAFEQLKPNDQVRKLPIDSSFSYRSLGNDPGFLVDLAEAELQPQPLVRLTLALILASVLFGLYLSFPSLNKELRIVPLGMLIVGGAVLALSTVSKFDTHPDEVTHVTNAEFYRTHYKPPEACSDETRYTYTTYGVSRLDNREIAYYLGGRYLQLVEAIPATNYSKLRYLNVALFLMLLLMAVRAPQSRILFLPLLLTPQAWYLFSYYNSDALSLFAVYLAAFQVFVPTSILRRLLRGERPPTLVLGVILIALVIALQYWVKLNYIFYPLFLIMLGLSWWILNRRMPDLTTAAPIMAALVLGTSLFLSWEVSRHAINDFSLAEKAYSCREITAGRLYKPSTPLDKVHLNFRLRDKGYSLVDMVTRKNWFERIYSSALGTYGYTQYSNSINHYKIVSLFILLLFAYVVVTVLVRGDAMARMAVLSTIAAIGGITFAAALNNWDQDYQPQGRYLMVYLPLFGSLMAMYAHKLSLKMVTLLGLIPFLMGLYSFYAVALIEIPKV